MRICRRTIRLFGVPQRPAWVMNSPLNRPYLHIHFPPESNSAGIAGGGSTGTTFGAGVFATTAAAATASTSHLSFSTCPTCPRTHLASTSCTTINSSNRFHRSRLRIGSFEFFDLFQPNLFHLAIHSVGGVVRPTAAFFAATGGGMLEDKRPTTRPGVTDAGTVGEESDGWAIGLNVWHW